VMGMGHCSVALPTGPAAREICSPAVLPVAAWEEMEPVGFA